MGIPVVIVSGGGLPVTVAANAYGVAMTVATKGYGMPVTEAAGGVGLAVTGMTFTPGGGGGDSGPIGLLFLMMGAR